MFLLPQLPYDYSALEPFIDAETMELHHSKHHATYVTKLNEALEGHDELASRQIEDLLINLSTIPEDIKNAVRNHGGGHHNHALFWESLTPSKQDIPSALHEELIATFSSIEDFKSQFTATSLGRFGSGWGWLVWDGQKLAIISTANQDSPLSDGMQPLLGLDVWEHAYYLKYQNRRPEYVEAWWNIINWPIVDDRLNKAKNAA